MALNHSKILYSCFVPRQNWTLMHWIFLNRKRFCKKKNMLIFLKGKYWMCHSGLLNETQVKYCTGIKIWQQYPALNITNSPKFIPAPACLRAKLVGIVDRETLQKWQKGGGTCGKQRACVDVQLAHRRLTEGPLWAQRACWWVWMNRQADKRQDWEGDCLLQCWRNSQGSQTVH